MPMAHNPRPPNIFAFIGGGTLGVADFVTAMAARGWKLIGSGP